MKPELKWEQMNNKNEMREIESKKSKKQYN